MHIQSARRTEETTTDTATRPFGRPKCPNCRSVLLVAEQSAFSIAGRIRHIWACDDCGHKFVTSIRLWHR